MRKLDFISERKKTSHILMKFASGFAVCRFLIAERWIIAAHVVVVALLLHFVWIGAVEAKPSVVEGRFVGNVRAKQLNGGLQSIEASLEESGDVVRPSAGDRVDGKKLGHDRVAELCCRGSAASLPFAPQPQAMRSKSANEHTKERDQCDGYCGLYFSLPLWIYAYWPTMRYMKPNVQSNRPARLFAQVRLTAGLGNPLPNSPTNISNTNTAIDHGDSVGIGAGLDSESNPRLIKNCNWT